MSRSGVPVSRTVPRVRSFHKAEVLSHLYGASPVGNAPTEPHRLTVAGQGVVRFTHTGEDSNDGVEIYFTPKGEAYPRLFLNLTNESSEFYWQQDENSGKNPIESIEGHTDPLIPDGYPSSLVRDDAKTTYWVSIDNWNKALRFGIGEMRLGTVVLERIYGTVNTLLDDEDKKFPEMAKMKDIHPTNASLEDCWTDPVVVEPPVVVVPTDSYTMQDAATQGYLSKLVQVDARNFDDRQWKYTKTTPMSLSREAQRLYGNVTGTGFGLSDDFITALEYSLRDPEGLGYKILLYKLEHSEFNPQGVVERVQGSNDYTYKEIYLRITLGQSQGDSPGVPYVMEIWPGGCGSPIHDHGGTFAVIKVLHGQINIDVHRQIPYNNEPTDPFRKLQFIEGGVTFITPQANQIHRLRNLRQNENTCVTIQCYNYPDDDKIHDPYFHYVEDQQPGDFDPLSDYDFISFHNEVMGKWTADGQPAPNLKDMWWQTWAPSEK